VKSKGESSASLPAPKSEGLAGVVVADTNMSFIDGEKGVLKYCGYSIEDLAANSTFEEIVYLLYRRELPNKEKAEEMIQTIGDARKLPSEVVKSIDSLAGKTSPMSLLRTVVSIIGHFEESVKLENLPDKALRLIGQIGTAVAMIDRKRNGLEYVKSDSKREHADDFIRMLTGNEPTEIQIKALNQYLVLLADHGFNASTFSARVTAGTLANLHAATTSAMGTLSGPLHGGANERAMNMILDVGTPEKAAEFVKECIEKKQRIMGFGHRVYKVDDPRAPILKSMSKKIWEEKGDMTLFETAEAIEREVKTAKPGLITNVDFYSATLLYGIGVPPDLFTPLFAMSRVAGWTAHTIEQYGNNRLIRPRARYVGATDRTYVPIDKR
tara:strand:- start:3908 stop:5056 length:1149 start_codon:yes stop_codon:yes gene_type:complete